MLGRIDGLLAQGRGQHVVDHRQVVLIGEVGRVLLGSPLLPEIATAYRLTGGLAEIGREVLGRHVVDHDRFAFCPDAMHLNGVEVGQVVGFEHAVRVRAARLRRRAHH